MTHALQKLAEAKTLTRAAAEQPAVEVKAAAVDGALRDVELARPGMWKLSSGETEFDAQMLRDAADFFAASGGQAVPIKLGHLDDRFDGEPTFGSVTNVRYLEDDRGPVLLGDIVDMPQWLGAAAPKRWPNRSIEGWQNFEYDGRKYGLVLSGLAFLGVTPPGVRNIRSLADLQVALAASSATRLVASAPPDDPVDPPEATPEAPPSAGLPAARPETPAPTAEIPHTEGAGMNLAKYREALAGLPDDASEEDVEAALTAAGFTQSPAPPDPGTLFDLPSDPSPQQVAPSKQLAEVAAASGAVVLDAGVWKQAQEQIAQGVQAAAQLRERERDTLLLAAVKDGRVPPSNTAYWANLWDRDPKGTTAVVASLKRNLIPVEASGYDTDSDDDRWNADYGQLFPPTAKKGR